MAMKEIVKDGKLEAWEYLNNGNIETIPNDEIIQFKYYNPYNPWRGLAPLIAATLGIHIDFAAGLYNYFFFNNDSTPVGSIKSDQELSNEEADAAELRWAQKMKGVTKKGRVPVLGKGMEYKPIERKLGDITSIEVQKANREPILAAYNVPPIKVGLLDGVAVGLFVEAVVGRLQENRRLDKIKFAD
jgi:phage portal protein BeeE